MWPDNETATDLLGFDVHAQLLREVVTDASMLPVTIGVFGDWGGGKTSIMKMLEQSLEPDSYALGSTRRVECESVATVYVNTWQFEGYDDAKAALISSVLVDLKDHARFGKRVEAEALKLLRSVNWFRFGRLTLKHVAVPATAAFLTGGVAAIPAALAVAMGWSALVPSKGDKEKRETTGGPDIEGLFKEDPDKETASDVRAFRQQFTSLLENAGITSLVVLVDDLDRCSPERLLENLEAIKLFLSVDRTAFVIGADPRIVEHAIRYRYAERVTHNDNERETAQLVKDYLEKLVQVPYTLPRLSPSEIESYMVLLFCRKHLGDDDYGRCRAKCDENRVENRYRTFGFGDVQALLGNQNVAGDFAASLQFCAAAAGLIAENLKGNPRQVKRFLNAFVLRKKLARVARLDDIRDDILMKLMILEYAHPDRFRELFSWQAEHNGYPPLLKAMESVTLDRGSEPPGWATTETRKWLDMKPALAAVDLRNYFWVARDRLASTLSGVSLVSPVVRRVYEDALLDVKRRTAVATAKKLDADERASLFALFEQHVSREPGSSAPYEVLRFFADNDVPNAVEVYAKVLSGQPTESIPAPVGMAALTLMQKKPALKPFLEPVIAQLRATAPKTRVGTAIEDALKPRKP